jgi:hypothetical protein
MDLMEALGRLVKGFRDIGENHSEALLPSFSRPRSSGEELQGTLFAFAADQGLSLYVEEKLRQCGSELLAMSGKGLLHCAIMGYNRGLYQGGPTRPEPSHRALQGSNPNPIISRRFIDIRTELRTEDTTIVPSQTWTRGNYDPSDELYDKPEPFCMRHRIRMVRALLSYGISPNEKLGEETAWQCALSQCYKCEPIDVGALGQILKHMIMYGADTSVTIPSLAQIPLGLILPKDAAPALHFTRLRLELEELLATNRAREAEEKEPKSGSGLEIDHEPQNLDAAELRSPSILPNWILEIFSAILCLVLEVALIVLAVPKPQRSVEHRRETNGQAQADTEEAQQSKSSTGTLCRWDASSASLSPECCTQRVFRYVDCQCLYRRDKVKNPCLRYKSPGHKVREAVFLVELPCPLHSQVGRPYDVRDPETRRSLRSRRYPNSRSDDRSCSS